MSDLAIVKDKECIECKHFLMCPGKPKEVDWCLHFVKRQQGSSEVKKEGKP